MWDGGSRSRGFRRYWQFRRWHFCEPQYVCRCYACCWICVSSCWYGSSKRGKDKDKKISYIQFFLGEDDKGMERERDLSFTSCSCFSPWMLHHINFSTSLFLYPPSPCPDLTSPVPSPFTIPPYPFTLSCSLTLYYLKYMSFLTIGKISYSIVFDFFFTRFLMLFVLFVPRDIMRDQGVL